MALEQSYRVHCYSPDWIVIGCHCGLRLFQVEVSRTETGLGVSPLDSDAASWNAASVLVAIPAMLLFLYSSKWLISGLTLGGLKE